MAEEKKKYGQMLVYKNDDGKAVVEFEGLVTSDVELDTEAQDFANAINELSKKLQQGGGGDEPTENWQPPADWPSIPDPGEYEMYFLIEVITESSQINFLIQHLYIPNGNGIFNVVMGLGSISVDWGDGTFESAEGYDPEEYLNGIYNGESWQDTVLTHTYTKPGKYVIKYTCTEYSEFLNSIRAGATGKYLYLLAAKLGDGILLAPPNGQTGFSEALISQPRLEYIKYGGNQLPRQGFNNDVSLKKLEVTNPIKTYLYKGSNSILYGCSLQSFDFSEFDPPPDWRGDFSNSDLVNVVMPKCTTLPYGCFQNIFALKSISAPLCISADDYAVQNNAKLKNVELPICETLGQSAFQNCTALTEISLPKVTGLKYYAFYNCRSLKTIYLPSCTSIGEYAFQNCINLEKIIAPNCVSVDRYAFSNCYKLKSVVFSDSCTYVSTSFNNCCRLHPRPDEM